MPHHDQYTQDRHTIAQGSSLVLHYSYNSFLIEQPSFPSHLNPFAEGHLRARWKSTVACSQPPLTGCLQSLRAKVLNSPGVLSGAAAQSPEAALGAEQDPPGTHLGGRAVGHTQPCTGCTPPLPPHHPLHQTSLLSRSLPLISRETPERTSRLLTRLTDLLFTLLKQRSSRTRQLPEGRTSTSPRCWAPGLMAASPGPAAAAEVGSSQRQARQSRSGGTCTASTDQR